MKWLHITGICGKTTSNVAKMFIDMGWFVTGSDAQFFPPASTFLVEENIPHVQDYHYTHLTKDFWENELGNALDINEVPDLVLVVESVSDKNKEYLFAKNKGIDVRVYSKILSEYMIKENSVVVAGTAGKTTTTAIMVKLLINLGFDPSFMIGAETVDLEYSIKNSNSNWSVIEGDEYHNINLSDGPKFIEYKPKYLIIPSIGYEHQDVFPTEQSYVNAFRELVKIVPQDGVIVARYFDKKISETVKDSSATVIRYAVVDSVENLIAGVWCLVKGEEENIIFDGNGNEIMSFKTSLLGDFILEDFLAVVTLVLNFKATDIPLDFAPKGLDYLKDIKESIENFSGVKKRLEKLFESDSLTIIDDFGVAPNRARNSLNTVKKNYPNHKIIAVFEPNGGSRFKDERDFLENYRGVFDDLDELIIPELSEFNENLATTDEFIDRLTKLDIEVKHIENEKINEYIEEKIGNNKTVVIFFSSYRLDEISKELAEKIRNSNIEIRN